MYACVINVIHHINVGTNNLYIQENKARAYVCVLKYRCRGRYEVNIKQGMRLRERKRERENNKKKKKGSRMKE